HYPYTASHHAPVNSNGSFQSLLPHGVPQQNSHWALWLPLHNKAPDVHVSHRASPHDAQRLSAVPEWKMRLMPSINLVEYVAVLGLIHLHVRQLKMTHSPRILCFGS